MAASTLYWTGAAGDNAFMTAGNWNTARDGSGSSLAPGAGGAGDTLYIENTNAAISGAATGISIADMYLSFGGSLGTAGTPLTIVCTGTIRVRTSNGTHYIAATAAGTIATVSVQKTGTGKVYLGGTGAFTTIRVGPQCFVDIGSGCAVTTVKSAGVVDIANNTTDLTTLEVVDGTTTSLRPATTLNNGGGTSIMKGLDAAVTTLNVWNKGKHYHWSSSTISTSNVKPGGFATAKGSAYQCTVTDRESYEGGFNFSDSVNVTFTNSAIVIGEGSQSVI